MDESERKLRETWDWLQHKAPLATRETALLMAKRLLQHGSLDLPLPNALRLVRRNDTVSLEPLWEELEGWFRPLIEGLAKHGHLLRACPRDGTLFIREGKQVYCSDTCSGAVRQATYRKKKFQVKSSSKRKG